MARKPTNPIDIHVGSRLRLRRTLVGISQEELGAKLGLTFQQIQKYEKGANRISAGRLHKLADLLSVSVQFFYDDMPDGLADSNLVPPGFAEPEGPTPFVNNFATAEGVQLHHSFSKISDLILRRRIVQLVQALADSAGDMPFSIQRPSDSDHNN